MVHIKTNLLLLSAFCFFLQINTCYGQDCESTFELQLINIKGGYFKGQKVTLTSKADGTSFIQNSDVNGKVIFKLPCKVSFVMEVSNYTKKSEFKSSDGGYMKRTLSYEPNMAEKEKQFAMDTSEIRKVDYAATLLPDTAIVLNYRMQAPKNTDYFAKLTITLYDIEDHPLAYESLIITGIKRNKSIKGSTDKNGTILIYLSKGDSYTLHFKYNKNYATFDFAYTKGTFTSEAEYTYLGTKEIEKRKEEEAFRIIEEEKRIKKEREEFALECKKRSIALEEGYRRKLKKNTYEFPDTVISVVMKRNNWSEKLIICDVTGSMLPYASELSAWYQLNYKKEKNLQFIFFNDGDNMPDNKKIIGATGGIYYSSSKGIDSLNKLISYVIARGYGGDCAENNMEALILGVKMAKPFKELVAIVDNNSPVKDIELLKQFNVPVHFILCGVTEEWVMVDYLLIAWKTKGSVHTIEEDITKIARMSEGQEVKINNITYRIMGGEFVRITKL
ncbi:MAG: hypothetical protein ACOYN4_13090 [Bacteroidales bacterium]